MGEWMAVDAIVQQREKERAVVALGKLSSSSTSGSRERTILGAMETESADEEDAVQLENEVFADTSEAFDMNEEYADLPLKSDKDAKGDSKIAKSCFLLTPMPRLMKTSTDSGNVDDDQIEDDSKIVHQNLQTFNYSKSRVAGASSNDNSSSSTSSYDTVENDFQLYQRNGLEPKDSKTMANITLLCENVDDSNKENEEDHDKNKLIEVKSAGVSPASSVGGVYTVIARPFSFKRQLLPLSHHHHQDHLPAPFPH